MDYVPSQGAHMYPINETGLTHSASGLKQMTNTALLEVFDSLKCGDKVRIVFSGGFACTGKEPITVKVGRRSYSKKYKTHKIRLGKVDQRFGLFLYKRAPTYWNGNRLQSEEDKISLGHGDLGCVLYYLEKVLS